MRVGAAQGAKGGEAVVDVGQHALGHNVRGRRAEGETRVVQPSYFWFGFGLLGLNLLNQEAARYGQAWRIA